MAARKKLREAGGRYETAALLIRIALELMGSRQGLTLNQIQERFELSRSTALRMLASLDGLPGVALSQAPQVETDDPRVKRWRVVAPNLEKFTTASPAELTAFSRAVDAFKGAGLPREIDALKTLLTKVSALAINAAPKTGLDLEDELRVRGFLMRPGPRIDSHSAIIDKLDEALSSFRQVEILYRSDGRKTPTRRTVCPFGILSGRWAYLVAFDPQYAGASIAPERLKTYRIDRIETLELLTATYEQPASPMLSDYAQRSFGVYQETPSEVVWRFTPEVAAEAERFQFHPTQSQERQDDGSLIVRFRAGGFREMVQHLFTWRDAVEVLEPDALRQCWAEELAVSAKALGRSRSSRSRKSRP